LLSSLLLFLFLSVVFAAAQSADSSGPQVSDKARALQESAIVVDTHADTPQRFLDEGFDIGQPTPRRGPSQLG